jgi:hypothetical protein
MVYGKKTSFFDVFISIPLHCEWSECETYQRWVTAKVNDRVKNG